MDPKALADWTVSRLETWGTSVGMETFKDDGRGGGISLVLGGKVLVIDVDFAVDRTDPSQTRIKVSNVKTSYAISNAGSGAPSNGGSIPLDSFLCDTIEQFCTVVQRPAQEQNLGEAARLGMNISEQLQYLVMLDRLAARKDGGGLKWFGGVDELYPLLENFAKREAEAVASCVAFIFAPD